MTYKIIHTQKVSTYLIDLPKSTNDIIIEISFAAGYYYAPQGKQEIPHLLEHYLAGSLSKSKLDYGASTNIKAISAYAVIPRKNISSGLQQFFKSTLENPLDDETLFNKEQRILRNELAGIISNPEEITHRYAMNHLLENKKLFTANLEDFQTITFNDVVDYYRSKCQNQRTKIFIGVYQADPQILGEIQEALKTLPVFQGGDDKGNIPAKFAGFSVHRYDSLSNRAYLNLTWPAAISSADPKEQISMMLISDLLTLQDDGFLWQSLQEEKGIVYEIDGHVDYYQEFGFLSCGAPFMLEDLKAGFSIIMKQVERIKKADYSETILKKFQKRCIQADKRRWNHNFDRFVWVMGDIIDRGRTYELEEWLSFYEGLDKNYLAEVANKYLDNQRLQISILASKDNKVDLSFFEHYA